MMYGQDGYYPGESDYESDGVKGTDDFHTYGAEPDDRALAMLAARAKGRKTAPKRIRSFGEHTPLSEHPSQGRNDHFVTGAVADPPAPKSRLTGAPSAIAYAEHEKWNRDAGNAANLAASQQIHNRAVHEQIHKDMA